MPGIAPLVKMMHRVNSPELYREFCGLKFSNPVGLAAGFDKNAETYSQLSNFGFSFIEIGTITPKPQLGNPKPRSFRFTCDKALINRMGFNNKGLDEAVKHLQNRKKDGLIIGGNIGKNTHTPNGNAVNDYIECFNGLYDHVDYFVINISCPNIEGLKELQDKDSLFIILSELIRVRQEKKQLKPILLKISPDLNNSQLDDIIDIVKRTGTDGIVATNTTIKRDNLSTPQRKIEKTGKGGLSGAPLNQRSTEVIRYISEKSGKSIPVIGVGGIMTTKDAIDKIEAGALLVQLYTGLIYNGPWFVKQINKAILKTK